MEALTALVGLLTQLHAAFTESVGTVAAKVIPMDETHARSGSESLNQAEVKAIVPMQRTEVYARLREIVQGVEGDLVPPLHFDLPGSALSGALPLSWWLYRSRFFVKKEPKIDEIAAELNRRVKRDPVDSMEAVLLEGIKPWPDGSEVTLDRYVLCWFSTESDQLYVPALVRSEALDVAVARELWRNYEIPYPRSPLKKHQGILEALNLVSSRPVSAVQLRLRVQGWHWTKADIRQPYRWVPTVHGGGEQKSVERTEPTEGSLAPFTSADAARACGAARRLRDVASGERPGTHYGKRIHLALRQFSRIDNLPFHSDWDGDREALEEETVLRCCYALEPLLGDKEDLSYKIALRAAYLVARTDEERQRSFELFRRAYKARSELVHKGETKVSLDVVELWRHTQRALERALALAGLSWEAARDELDAAALTTAAREHLLALLDAEREPDRVD